MNEPGRVDQVVAHRRRPQNHAALAAERLGQRRRHHHIGRTRQPELVQQPAPAATHTQPVRLVDDEQRAVAAAHVVQFAQRGQCAVGAEHRCR